MLTYPSVVGQVTPIMLNKIGYGTYILFGLLTFMGAGFIWFFVPETKRLTLEEMVSICGATENPGFIAVYSNNIDSY